MNNFVIILVLLAGLLGGYFIGDYRGANARRALAQAEETGKQLADLQQKYNAQLNADLETIRQDYQNKIDSLNQRQESDNTKWESIKASRDSTIKELEGKLKQLGTHPSQLYAGQRSRENTQEIQNNCRATASAKVQSELNGIKCLSQEVPNNILELLNGVQLAGGAQ